MTVGAITDRKKKSNFSSVGFTADYRVKPDVCLGYGLLRDRSYGEYPLRERYLFRYADLSGVGCLSMASVSPV